MESFTLVCPDCQERRTFRVLRSEHLAACRECGLPVLMNVVPLDDVSSVPTTRPQEPPITRRQTDGLPTGIANDVLEACRCYSFMAYRGAGLLARRAVEQAVVMLGVPPTKKTLQQKLHWLLEASHLPRQWTSSAATILDVGNAAAHGASAISRDEAHAVVTAALSVVTVLVGEGRSPEVRRGVGTVAPTLAEPDAEPRWPRP